MVFTKKRDKSPSTTPVPSTEAAQNDGSQLPEAQWDGMLKVLNHIYDYRTEDDFDPSKLFHRLVNKRVIPEYYETIKEPVALSTIKKKINTHAYQTIREFVRDFALIPYNAQVFNRPDSGAFQDALIVKGEIEKQLQKLAEEGVISKEDAVLPDLGEIPTYEDPPAEEADEEEEESDNEGEEDEDDEDDEGKKKRRGPRGTSGASRRDTLGDDDGQKARGRPPKLLTPMEARILAILKGIRKPKNDSNQLMIRDFDRLPDRLTMPEYYLEIKNPMAYDLLKRKVKRKKYKTIEEFMADVNLMFNNAKEYNTDDSEIFKHAVALQIEAGRLYDIEKAKSDNDFADEEGKIPLPDGILHNGELYKVGDWVHIRNPNDLTKPMPAQIYRTYRDQAGNSMVNVCWYYRPEQTVHRFDKHFLANEVVKTGRYRDHSIDEIEGRCFVMFTTRYFKGRPRGLSPDLEIYVCEARYNEERHQFNKIKTWASCLPDEVRDRDYEMDLFDHQKKMKKFPSPIAYMLKDEQTESDEMPKPTWGAEGAPPKFGAVHKRPRGEKDSPTTRANTSPSSKDAYTSAETVLHPTDVGLASTCAPTFSTTQFPTFYATASTCAQQTPSTYAPRPPTATGSHRDPPAMEAYILPDQANLSIPLEIRERFQRDEMGRVLFFTAPPVIPDEPIGVAKGHSVRYLAEKARREDSLRQKRKAAELEKQAAERVAKKARIEQIQQVTHDLEATKRRALGELEAQLAASVTKELDDGDLGRLTAAQKATAQQRLASLEHEKQRIESRKVSLSNSAFADDSDNRLS
ncbi:hypothetical protein Q7P37_007274 [Cladosporium fusiforme]